MKKLFFIPLAVLSISMVNAQTADDIINKHIEAVGGKDKIEKTTSITTESSIEIMGNESTGYTTILYYKGARNELSFQGQKIVQVMTDKGGWSINPMQGATAPAAMPDAMYKSAKDVIYPEGGLFNYKDLNNTVSLEGQEKIGTVNAWKIKLVNADGASTLYYIDPSTYYIIQFLKQAEMMGQKVDMLTIVSDYKKTDSGRMVPYTTEVHFGDQFTITSHLKKIEDNKAVDPAIFEMK